MDTATIGVSILIGAPILLAVVSVGWFLVQERRAQAQHDAMVAKYSKPNGD